MRPGIDPDGARESVRSKDGRTPVGLVGVDGGGDSDVHGACNGGGGGTDGSNGDGSCGGDVVCVWMPGGSGFAIWLCRQRAVE